MTFHKNPGLQDQSTISVKLTDEVVVPLVPVATIVYVPGGVLFCIGPPPPELDPPPQPAKTGSSNTHAISAQAERRLKLARNSGNSSRAAKIEGTTEERFSATVCSVVMVTMKTVAAPLESGSEVGCMIQAE